MVLKTALTQHSREELARHLSEGWFQELLEVLRTRASLSERQYSAERTISEMDHQALNGSFREGAVTMAMLIPMLAQDPKERPKQLPEQFGTLLPTAPDPKSISQQPIKPTAK